MFAVDSDHTLLSTSAVDATGTGEAKKIGFTSIAILKDGAAIPSHKQCNVGRVKGSCGIFRGRC